MFNPCDGGFDCSGELCGVVKLEAGDSVGEANWSVSGAGLLGFVLIYWCRSTLVVWHGLCRLVLRQQDDEPVTLGIDSRHWISLVLLRIVWL